MLKEIRKFREEFELYPAFYATIIKASVRD